jgi:hypothetical protein
MDKEEQKSTTCICIKKDTFENGGEEEAEACEVALALACIQAG